MQSKNKNNKTRNTKNKKEVANTATSLSAKLTAEIVGCSESTVKKIRTEKRTDQSVIGMKVKLVDEFYEEGTSLLIKEIKRIVTL